MWGVFLTASLLFIAAGFARGNSAPANSWLKALLLISLCVLVLIFASGAPPVMLGLIATVSYAASLAGISARRSWAVNRTRSIVTVTTMVAVIAIGSLFGAPVLATRLENRAANTPTPEFAVTRVDGRIVNSSALKGRVGILDFWATWCLPCHQEFPDLEKLYQRYKANPNVTFLAIDVNRDGESPEKARAFVEKAGYTIPIAYDTKEAVTRPESRGLSTPAASG